MASLRAEAEKNERRTDGLEGVHGGLADAMLAAECYRRRSGRARRRDVSGAVAAAARTSPGLGPVAVVDGWRGAVTGSGDDKDGVNIEPLDPYGLRDDLDEAHRVPAPTRPPVQDHAPPHRDAVRSHSLPVPSWTSWTRNWFQRRWSCRSLDLTVDEPDLGDTGGGAARRRRASPS